MESEPEKEEQWLICPVCKQPNRAGTLHCKYCWGASLYQVEPISSEELKIITQRRLTREKRFRTLRTVSISIFAPLLLFAAIFLGTYSFTDIIFAPPANMHSSPLPDEWTMFRHDLNRLGTTDSTNVIPEGNLKWVFSADAEIHSSPAVVDGVVYVGSRDFNVYAIDAETGEKLWSFKTGTWVESSPTVVDGIVYIGSNDGKIYAIDADNGRELWHFQTQYAVKCSPAVANGMVFCGSDDYNMYALDAVTGKKIWDFETGSHVISSPAIDNGIVYFGSMDGACYALNAVNGRFRLRFKSNEVISSPAVNDGVVYYNSRSYLYAIDGNARNWPGEMDLRGWWMQFYAFRLAPAPPPVSGYMWRIPLGRSSASSPIVTNDYIYTTSDNRMYRIDLLTGNIDWVFYAGDTLRSSPALTNNILYVGSEDGNLYAVDANTGQSIWYYTTEDEITSSPAVADGVVYIGSHDGKLYAIK